MDGSASLPTWSELFGSLDTKEADPGRSVNSPAAYLADLLQLLKDRFDPSDFRSRRPDIPAQILLNGDQSNSLVRQLDIANQVLRDRIAALGKKSGDQVLAEAQQPFLLPFEYQHERIRQLLLLLQTSYRDLHTGFAQQMDVDVLARERLGLSPARAATVAGLPGNAANLGIAYGLAQEEELSTLVDLERFQRATQLDGPSLRQLLFSQLSQSPSKNGGPSEREAAGQLFINQGLGGFVKLDANEQRLIWSVEGKEIPDAWFDRVHRLLCLSRWTGVDLPSLDLVLRQVCSNTLDLNALRRVAVLVDMRDRTKAPIDVLCSLFGELDGTAALGAGDDPQQPASLFDRVFNGAAALLAKRYVPSGSDYLPQAYAGWGKLTATGDVLVDVGDNKELRARIQASLGISAADLAALIKRFRDRATSRARVSRLVSQEVFPELGGEIDSHSLSVLHRVTRLAEFVDLPPLDLLQLVDVVENDPNLKVLNCFDVLYHEDTAQADLYQVLEQGSVDARSWLIQNISAIAAWAGAAGLEPADLHAIVVVPAESTPTQISSQTSSQTPTQTSTQTAQLLATAQALHDAFLPTALSADSLQSDAISERTARIAVATFQQPERRLVSTADARLATWNKHRACEAAHAALAALDVVSVDDIGALQLGEDLATYLQSLLLRRGVLDANGILLEDQLPVRAEDLVLEPEGSAEFGQIFDFLNDLYTTALSESSGTGEQQTAGDGSDGSVADNTGASDQQAAQQDAVDGGASQADPSADVELHLYPSDLLKLGFAIPEADEWIERLTFLRVLDATGMVQDPSIFADPASRDSVQISVGLNSFCGEIHAWLSQRRDRWLSAILKLPDGIWDALPLSAAERGDLEQNLIFNDHIDAARRILDRQALEELTPDTFDLGLEFHRHCRLILNALQQVVSSSRANYLMVGSDNLRPLADKFVAADIHKRLSAAYLDGQMRLSYELVAEIDHEQPPFDLGSAYSTAQGQSVWNLLQQIHTEASKFRLTDAALASVNITGEHAINVVVSLCADGCLQPDGSLSPELAARFAVVSSAQTFVIPQYADYSRDVFFLIHDVAVAVQTAVKALTTSLEAAANAQEKAVVGAIASQIQLSPEATSAVLRPLLGDESSVAVAIMAPVLRALVEDVLEEAPSDRMFCAAMRRTQAFANFSGKLRMSPRAIEVAFKDQQLADKFPEGIELPPGVDGIDALWAGPSGQPSGSATFSTGDFLNLASLAGKLEQPTRPIDTWLAAQLTRATTAALASYRAQGSDPASLETALLHDINPVLVGPAIYDSQRFIGVTLRPMAQKRLSLGIQAGDLRDLNRLLIEDAYPLELAKNQLYLFRGRNYWTYDANTLEIDEGPLPLTTLCVEFKDLHAVDAVYTLPTGEHWLLAEGNAWCRAADSARWVKDSGQTARQWGRVQSRFDDPASIDGALLDREGRIHLFCGDQYVRYSKWPQQQFVDEGYPRRIATHWSKELGFGPLPPGWDEGIDAAVGRGDEVTWLFKDDQYIASTEPGVERNIVDFWGHVRNNLGSVSRVDAIVDLEGRCGVVVGDQVSVFSNSLESQGLTADEGYPRTLPAVFHGLPEPFDQGIDAGLTNEDGTIHLFRDQKCASRNKDGKWDSLLTSERWGLVSNTLRETGHVNAAFAGLDGKIYLFSGEQYVRYSGTDLSRIDEGYPKTIRGDWGGLAGVDTAFVLDGKTYLFGSDHRTYVCYSTRDYTKTDTGYPKEIDQNWWNLPVALLQLDFHHPDAVFIAADGRIHLFRGNQTINFDHNHRWWSEPVPIQEGWKSLPFASISAAFTGRDGRAYIFSNEKEPSFVRYTDRTFQRVDDRFPKSVKENLGKLVNNIERSGRVDAAVSIMSTVSETDAGGKVSEKKIRYRYLFSGDQFYRYSTDAQRFVDEGYPLRIQNNLRREPHFAHLDAPAERGIDGVWADTGNVFVFISDQMYVASSDHFRKLDGLGIDEPRAADVEEGRLTVFGKDGWRHILPPEARTQGERAPDYVRLLPEPAQAVVPRVLRMVPPQFQGKLSAILRGLDNNVYLFSETQCYDHSLQRKYPTGAAWGHVQNHIAEDERVDCALMGRDGKLYLFRGDQFVSYTPTKEAPAMLPDLADTIPSPIADHWGGLSNVRYAFVQKGVTYLLEVPAEDGSFRYVRYFGTDYTRPNEPVPLYGDFSFWEVPDNYVSRGFDRVDAVLSEGDDLILIRDAEFIHYDAAADTWSIRRPLSLRWPGLSRHYPDFETIRAVVRGPDNKTYFFADGTWLFHDGNQPSPLAAISSRWALLSNRITQSNRVDATLVYGDQTFLFSGDAYVRYTGSEYQYVDAGYPRRIAGFLRREAPFQQLPDDIETAFESLKPEDMWVAAAFSTGGVVVVTVAGRSYALSAHLSRSYPLQQVARVRNELVRRARVDAAFAREKDGALFLLSGDQYVRYSQPELNEVDDGYPRSIAESLLAELGPADEQRLAAGADHAVPEPAQQRQAKSILPLAFQENLDAAIYDRTGALVLFKGKQFVRSEPDAAAGELAPKPIKETWGRVGNPFLVPQSGPPPRIDAAFVAPDHSLYVFKGDQYLRYTDPTAAFVDEGYPRAIRDEWGDLPGEFKGAVDGAFVFDGRTYLCHDKSYVRYGDPSYSRMDPTYPQLFTNRWRAANDFSLGDLRSIQRYVALDQSHPSDNGSLTDFLLASPRDNVDPYALLATLFDWQVGDVQWLKRHDAFLDRPKRDVESEVNFDIAQVLRIYSTLELARRMGSHPQELYDQVWTPLYAKHSDPTPAADTLERLLGTLYPGDDWKRIQRQLGDALSRMLRDAQVGWLLAHSPELPDARSLSDLLLTDVEVDASLDTSRIVEATAAVQLYFYRYLMNLEPALAKGDDATRRSEFRQQWRWLQNYRVWEANRKVFLYPESYIRPELRTARTAAFDSLQQNLQQGEITNDSVTLAYKKYLDEYTEVSRLIIAGGYLQADPQNAEGTELTLFGATRTDPRRYYYRTASFPNAGGSSAAVWRAWQALGIQINSDRVYPVRAFGRTFVFWAEVEQIKPDDQTSTTLHSTTTDNVQTVTGTPQVEYRAKIMYSFCDLSNQWTLPQTLAVGPTESVPIKATHLRVSSDGEQSIVVDFYSDVDFRGLSLPKKSASASEAAQAMVTLTRQIVELLMGLPWRIRGKSLSADLTVSDVPAAPVVDLRSEMLNGLFDSSEIGTQLDLDNVITIDSASRENTAPWYSFDMKGGSFLARPVETRKNNDADVTLVQLAQNPEMPKWDHVDACLDGSDGKQYLFNNQNLVYSVLGDPTEHRIDPRWGLRKTKVYAEGQVDAAWQRDGVLFLSRLDTYLKYSKGLDWADDDGDRGSPAQREEDGVPKWPSIDAAFTDKSKTTWFFQGPRFVSVDAAKKFGPEALIKEHWGHERNEFAAPAGGGPVVVAAFNRDGRSYLIGPNYYTWYTNSDVTYCVTPKKQSLRNVLTELKCSNVADVDASATITGAMDGGTELLFKVRSNAGDDVYSFADNKVTLTKRTTKAGPWQDVAAFMYANKRFAFTPTKTGLAVTVSGSDEQHAYSQDIRAALLAGDGNLYLFSKDSYVQVASSDVSVAGIGRAIDQWRSKPIAESWGEASNVFTQGGVVSAALVHGEYTFLVSGDSYVRYSGTDYSFVDEDYPKPLAGNSDGLPQVPFRAGVEYPDGRMCYFEGTDYVFSNDLSKKTPNKSQWGRIRSNILVRGVDTAYRVDKKHYLFSGDEIACYTAGSDGKIPEYMDSVPVPQPVRAELGSFGVVRAAFSYKDANGNGFLYLVGRDSFVCCTVDQPEQLLPEYPRSGRADALIADLRRRFHPSTDGAESMAAGFEVYAISLQGSMLLLDTGDDAPGQRILRLDLSNGRLSRDLQPPQMDWAALRRNLTTYVDVDKVRYIFRANQVMTTDTSGPAPSDSTPWDAKKARPITAVWGGRPFDAAIPMKDQLVLFVGDSYCNLAQAAATDNSDVMVGHLRNALAARKPIRGSLTNLPAELMDGFDAALAVNDSLYLFKGSHYAKLSGDAKPQPVASIKYELVRLTTSTAARLNRELFTGGVPGLLSLRTQEVGETPGFSVSTSTPTIIHVNPDRVNADTLPIADHLDFGSANGVYLWEIFFHAPALIADMLSTAQKFEQAKTWYEYIFDPTEPAEAWKFLPFVTEDVERIVLEIGYRLDRLELPEKDQLRVELAPYTQALLDMDAAFQGERSLSKDEINLLGLTGKQIEKWQLSESGVTLDAEEKELLDPALLDKRNLSRAQKEVLKRLQDEIPKQLRWQAGVKLDDLEKAQSDKLKIGLCEEIRELFRLIGELKETWEVIQTSIPQTETYLDDPFDPHAIAALRPIAYRKAIVMGYLDNLLRWGDMLFTEYIRESINQARMLYVEAWDVLGWRPESLGRRILPADSAYDGLAEAGDGPYDMLLRLHNTRTAYLTLAASLKQTPNGTQAPPYFFIPTNDDLDQYWTRVADRLYKIRNGLNILGVKEPLPLFAPPINPMDLVRAVAGNGLAGLADGAAGLDVPHYRFTFLMAKAKELAQTVAQLGSELLAALEKRDAEALSQLQMTQEGVILTLTREMQKSQLEEAKTNLQSLQKAKENAQKRQQVYSGWVNGDYLPTEIGQIALLSVAVYMNIASALANTFGVPLSLLPAVTVGLFSFGETEEEFEKPVQSLAMAFQTMAGAVSGLGEILGITAQHQRSMADWTLQRDLAAIDMDQIDAQIAGANWQIQSAQQQIAMTEKQIEQNKAVSDFYRSKFTNQELYTWMICRLSDLHYQTYQLTLDMARAAERSFQFERGKNGAQSFIQAQAWDSQRKGLLSGYTLGLALQRMEAAFIATDARRFEITKSISLLQLDPMAFLKLRAEGACEFDLGEALFDYDFPGHYCRQVKTIAVDLAIGDGIFVNATLTQLTNRIIMEPDAKAVSFLLVPKETPPQSIRTNWKAQQQIALSTHTQYETNSGVFELNFDGDRYLPFEGTGAVSRWRLELGGPPGSYDLGKLTDVTITLKYTALQGGDAFAASVRGLLKPTDVLRAFNLSVDFADLWTAFLQGDSDTLQLPLTQALFPNMVSGAIRAIFTRYQYDPQGTGGASLLIDMGQQVPLPDGKTVDTSGLMVRAAGTALNLKVKGDKSGLKNAYLVMGYKGGVR